MLEAWLDYHRQTSLFKCAGLTDEQLKCRCVAPSGLSLLGLVRHLAFVERFWFRRGVAAEPIANLYCSPANPDGDFVDVDDADAEVDFATYEHEVDLARRVAAGRSLDETFRDPRDQTVLSMRWVFLHLIGEYSRHNGHADLLRERIDGATGE